MFMCTVYSLPVTAKKYCHESLIVSHCLYTAYYAFLVNQCSVDIMSFGEKAHCKFLPIVLVYLYMHF